MRRLRSTATAALAVAAFVLAPAPAQAAHAVGAAGRAPSSALQAATTPKCHGTTCEHHLASAMGCEADAYVVASTQVTDPQASRPPEVDLWYSPACLAAWGEYFTTDPLDVRDVALYAQNQYGGVEHGTDVGVTGNGDYRTKMFSWDNSLKFCAQHNGLDPDQDPANANNGFNVCTRWR